jgi:hypothetical protein
MATPTISPPPVSLEVCIPTRKPSPLFFETLQSVCRAAVPELSLLVFQNAEKPFLHPGDLDIFPGKKRLLCSGSNLDIAGSWNRIVELAEGDWIHLLHDDDWIEPDFYRAFLRDLREQPPFGIWACGAIDHFEEIDLQTPTAMPDLFSRDREGIGQVMLGKAVTRCAGVMLNRRYVLDCGGFERRMSHTLDVELFYRMACAHGIRFNAGRYGHYRVHALSTTGKVKRRKGQPAGLPIFDEHRLLQDHLVFLSKEIADGFRTLSFRAYSAAIVRGSFRYYLKRLRVRSFSIWFRCWLRHLHYCLSRG